MGPQTDINRLPTGWDAADAVEEGWTFALVSVLLAQAQPYVRRSLPVGANDNWQEPDLSILDTDTSPPAFPLEIFPPQVADWLVTTALSKSAAVDYVAATLLTGCASLIGNSRRVSPWMGWSEPAILWTAIDARKSGSAGYAGEEKTNSAGRHH